MKYITPLLLCVLLSSSLFSANNTLKRAELKNNELRLVFSSWIDTSAVHQMTLNDPPRQVIDIKNATLVSQSLASGLSAKGVRSFRIAQRDDNVVRIVIETDDSYPCKGYQPMSSRTNYQIPLPKNSGSASVSESLPYAQAETTVPTSSKKAAPAKRERRSREKAIEPAAVEVEEEIPEEKPSFFSFLFSSKSKSSTLDLRGSYTVVVDAGHGGHDSGAIGQKRYYEKDMVLKIAKRVEKHLVNKKFKVRMTRSGDTFVDLKNRTHYANRHKADIFVSIHANAIADKSRYSNVYGVETYFLQTSRSEKSKRIAAIENSVVLDKNDFLSQNVILEAVLSGPKIELSHKLAIDVQTKILGSTRRKYRGVKDGGVIPAPFWVLVGAQMPSILVEVGYVSNPAECQRLLNSDYQDRIAKGIADGITNYLINREKVMN